MGTRTMTWAQASARRLARSGLAVPSERRASEGAAGAPGAAGGGPADGGPSNSGAAAGLPAGTPAAVLRALCGAQAQVLSAAESSVGMRIDGATRADVRRALWDDRTVVKTFGPRGTVHLLPAADLPLWTGALGALPSGSGNGGSALGGTLGLLTPDQAEAVVAAAADALADAELTVDELTDAIAARAGSWAADPVMEAFQTKWPRWRAATALAAHRGALCFGPNKGRKVTYTSPQRWLPGFAPAAPDEALGTLVRRYLHSYGPATPQDFARWLAAPAGWARTLFAARAEAGEIEPVELAGVPSWVVAGDHAEAPAGPARGVRLLPYFDAYAIACRPRELLFPGRAYERALAGGQAGNFPVLLIDGEVAGVWHQRRSGRRIAVTVEPLDALAAPRRRALEEEVARLGQIMEGRAELTVGRVAVGAHA
ncbi:winged helix DNA-binding domain-containing protein [Streptomyces sp. WMMC500]|uniref:winged helix DNA-binding domain-containing protein n=1 Tax=Streptomyces sp. WMMC500 TaxID=3015154 RepID=UPI00248B1287|nr:winged helix DNA-binding domain-containing protein [Streptomyces sp. WMMC500]WBB58691.1 winged helix DNA-binding domain-containing protein [Streptomyces sp. WMMC500]